MLKKFSIILFVLVFCLPCILAGEKPNFVFFLADDISQEDFGCYGHPTLKTPHTDGLAANGMRFDNAYLITSSCSPSRCSIITGRYPHNTGAPELHVKLPDGQIRFTELLRKDGYYTVLSGKNHMFSNKDRAFDKITRGGGPGGEKDWVEHVQNRPKDKPFFFWFASNDAHRGWAMSDHAPVYSNDQIVVPPYLIDGEKTRGDLAKYSHEVSRFDHFIGLVTAELKKQGVLDNTMIVIASDNGRPFPRCKSRMYDSGIKTPWVVHYPKMIERQSVSKSLVSVIDLSATCLELAGIEKPGCVQGQSFVPILKNPKASVREMTFSEHNWHVYKNHERMVRFEDFLYIKNNYPNQPNLCYEAHKDPAGKELWNSHAAGKTTPKQQQIFTNPCPEEELYLVSKDPDQFTNLANDPEYTATLKKARSLLKSWTEQTGDTVPENPTPNRHSPPRVEGGKIIPAGKKTGRTNPHAEMPGAAKNAMKINHPGPVRLQDDDRNYDLTKEIDFQRKGTWHLGPTGAHGWMYVKKQKTHEARQILITEVETGSPADGILQKGDVILGIGGRHFDADARKLFGLAIDEAEKKENKGILKLTRWRPIKNAKTRKGKEQQVKIKLKVRGAFSDTAPYNCLRSKKLMEASLKRIEADAAKKKFGRIDESLLALMAVGGDEQMRIVRAHLHQVKWAKPDYKISLEDGGLVVWSYGMHGLIMTEYYLATGDDYVLPAIKEHAVKIAMGQSSGGLWGHGFAWKKENNGKLHGSLRGYGALNLAGLPCLLTMVMAEKCGISHPEIDDALDRALPFFADFVGRGTIGYGYHQPSLDHNNSGRNGQASNGKNAIAGLIFTMAGDRKVSQYYSSLAASNYDEYEHGHAGNSFSRFWNMMGVNCGGPEIAAAYHKELRWYNALCRGWDGRIMFQPLGGTYGGATPSLDAACVLANALPLRKLYITGKGSDEKLWLTKDQVKSAIDAGRWHWADCDSMGGKQLIRELDCWSPGAREWIAEALGRKEKNYVPQLIKAFDSESADMRAGVCTALGYHGQRAAPAIDLLVKALSDKASTVRVAAAYAIMRTGKPGRKAIPDMLKAVVNQEKESPLEPVLQALSYSLGADRAGTAPLYFVGIFPSTPEGENPLDGIDRKILYPAIERMISARSARIRDCGAYALRYFNRDDVKSMAMEIYNLAKYRAPDFGMFADRACGRGMDVLAKHQIIDGVEVCVDAILTPRWGSYWREPHHFLTLQEYGKTASSQLDRLKSAMESRKGDKRKIVEETIRGIENDKRDLKPVSLKELLDERLDDRVK